MKSDPRIRRTRQRLHDALLTLSIEHGYDAVTVQDVLTHSETARSTFYAHFRDKDDLLLSGFQEDEGPWFEHLFETHADEHPLGNFPHAWFEHIYQNKSLAKAFLGSSSAEMVMGHLKNLVVIEVRKLIDDHTDTDGAIPNEVIVQFVVGASFNLMTWWIDHDFPYSVQEISQACNELILTGLKKSVPLSNEPLVST